MHTSTIDTRNTATLRTTILEQATAGGFMPTTSEEKRQARRMVDDGLLSMAPVSGVYRLSEAALVQLDSEQRRRAA